MKHHSKVRDYSDDREILAGAKIHVCDHGAPHGDNQPSLPHCQIQGGRVLERLRSTKIRAGSMLWPR